MLRFFGVIAAIAVLLIGVQVMLWSVLDGSYTGLFGVQQSVGVVGRVVLVLLGVVLCLAAIGVVVVACRTDRESEAEETGQSET